MPTTPCPFQYAIDRPNEVQPGNASHFAAASRAHWLKFPLWQPSGEHRGDGLPFLLQMSVPQPPFALAPALGLSAEQELSVHA